MATASVMQRADTLQVKANRGATSAARAGCSRPLHRAANGVAGGVRGAHRFAGASAELRSKRNKVILHEAISSDEVLTEVSDDSASYLETPNGSSGNGVAYASNGSAVTPAGHPNGSTPSANGSSNGVALTGVAVNGVSSLNGASLNGATINGAAAAADLVIGEPLETVELLDSCDAGQLEACAAERLAVLEEKARLEAHLQAEAIAAAAAATAAPVPEAVSAPTSAAAPGPATPHGSPYQSPGGRWSNFRKYSFWQRTFQIWSFAISFFFKYWLSGKKFTYGKKAHDCEAFDVFFYKIENGH